MDHYGWGDSSYDGDMGCGLFLLGGKVQSLLAHRVAHFWNIDSETLLHPEEIADTGGLPRM